jgi:Fe2+ transport system protein FeoA
MALGVIRQVFDDCRDVWIDSETSKGNSTLPLLLHALIHDSGPQNRNNAGDHTKLSAGRAKIDADMLLRETHIPEIIASVLLELRRRALAVTLWQHGVFPGDRIRVVRVAPFGGLILVEINQREVALGRRVAAKVIVEIEQRASR